jgi:chromosome segregation protein
MLKALELVGFKSFADKTQFDFNGGITAIVGPNGSGKSNVVDAVRWILGEQSAKTLRGGEMADVIFKGSVSRPPMGVAEVTLILDNASGDIASQGPEVSITRRVFRSGEGEYLINGEKVRLKDVRDMLFDTGLGSRGYAVLEQGKIDAVLSANPLDRRAIFEEAAGVSRYRMRRKETDSKLKRVEADLLRLDDVLRELGTRVRSLKIQAGKAERYVEARDQWRAQRARYLRHRLHDHRGQLALVNGQISEIDGKAESLRRLRSDEESDVAAREREQMTLVA